MKKKTNVKWMPRAERNLKGIRQRIVDADMPKTARAYVSRLRKSAAVLRDFPEIGAIVDEFGDPTIREIGFDVYRIIYSYVNEKVSILTVHPGAQPLSARHLYGD